jgi:hypothetical protein
MDKKCFLLTLLLFPILLSSQVFDDFSDGDFTVNPAWVGDVNQFIVNSALQLQLESEVPDISHLVTGFQIQGYTEWSFWIRLDFAPSDNNLARVYLASDQQNVEGPVNGYFLKFGENLANDAIELYRQNGETVTLICRGTDGLIAAAFQLWVRVRLDMQGNWSIEVDNAGYGAYQLDATGTDNEILSSSFTGFYCKYTSSNIEKFFFDDFYAGPWVIDNSPPELVKIEAVTANDLHLYFNEALNPEPAGNVQNYFVSNDIEYPMSAMLDVQNPGLVLLTFDRPFTSGITLQITIQNISDPNGNIAPLIEENFLWFKPDVFDVQINEIMADPSPTVGLPDEEYIELLNLTDKSINLKGWKLIIGNTVRTFEEVFIQPEGYLLLGHVDAQGALSQFGDFYGFSGFQLTNAGQTVVLKNQMNQVISVVSYSDAWYDDAIKKEGGWSLEQIDPSNPCGSTNNWTASVNASGGTPGAENSVNTDKPDFSAPYARRVEVIDPNHIILHFSEPMDSVLIGSRQHYQIEPMIGTPLSAKPVQPFYQAVVLALSQTTAIENDVIYTLNILADFTDCAGNIIDLSRVVHFGLPKPVVAQDVVINEVLFNPKDDFVKGVEFVEIYNRSTKIIDLSTMILATEDKNTGEISSARNISEEGFLLFPESYLVLTHDPEIVKQQYVTDDPDAFLKMTSLPQYANSEGVVIIATKGLELIDRLTYSENMHIPLLRSFKGVSLERLHYDRPSHDVTNWHSAAEDAGFATPGYKNSQFTDTQIVDDPITVSPEIFSPDMDGKDDVLNISYRFDKPGFVGTITIFDSRGRVVRKLVNNELLGVEGVFTWDGFSDGNLKASIGIYIILFEVFDEGGTAKTYKKTAVLGGRL